MLVGGMWASGLLLELTRMATSGDPHNPIWICSVFCHLHSVPSGPAFTCVYNINHSVSPFLISPSQSLSLGSGSSLPSHDPQAVISATLWVVMSEAMWAELIWSLWKQEGGSPGSTEYPELWHLVSVLYGVSDLYMLSCGAHGAGSLPGHPFPLNIRCLQPAQAPWPTDPAGLWLLGLPHSLWSTGTSLCMCIPVHHVAGPYLSSTFLLLRPLMPPHCDSMV